MLITFSEIFPVGLLVALVSARAAQSARIPAQAPSPVRRRAV
jgi:hypothetical protein